MLVSSFNLWQSFNYTPYLFYKKRLVQNRERFFLYMDPGQWYEGNIFLIALPPFSYNAANSAKYRAAHMVKSTICRVRILESIEAIA